MVGLVCNNVAGASARAPALSFLAAIARDHGAMPQALTLFRCLRPSPHQVYRVHRFIIPTVSCHQATASHAFQVCLARSRQNCSLSSEAHCWLFQLEQQIGR